MKHQATHDLYDYWNSLRGARLAPERNDVDPVAIRHILADTFMLDIDAEARFPVRLAGTRVNGLFDAEQKGRSFLDLWRPEEGRNVAGLLMTVADGACPVVVGAAAMPVGESESALELLFLPMRHYGKTHSRILGMVKTVTPQPWVGLLPAGPLSLRSLRIVGDAEDRPTALEPARVHPAAPPRPAPGTRPVLRLVEGAKGLRPVRSLARERLKVLEVEVENGNL